MSEARMYKITTEAQRTQRIIISLTNHEMLIG